MRSTMMIAAALFVLASQASAQSMLTANTLKLDDPNAGVEATVDDLTWMAGHWKGAFLGGVAEETWTAPSGGSMLGMFKLVRDDGVSMYEIMTLVEEEGRVVLKLKHFNPDLTGWEEKDDHVAFPLVKLGHNEAFFDGLTFRRTEDGRLTGFLAMRSADGAREVPFSYERVEKWSGGRRID